MFSGISVYAENNDGVLDRAVAELATAAFRIKEKTGEPLQALLISEEPDGLIEQLGRLGFDEIYVVRTKGASLFKDDAVSSVVAQALSRIRPSAVLIPADTAGALFSRVAVLMDSGLTADCTSLEPIRDGEDGEWHIRQDKPSFGDNVVVSIVTKRGHYPQMMTVRQGVYAARAESSAKQAAIYHLSEIAMPESGIEILDMKPYSSDVDNIASAQMVCVAGRGAMEGDNMKLLREFAGKLGCPVAGTRPLADDGMIPFDNQIGQTGKTIRPKICLSFGVSGAIQHTEGIRDAKLFIAVNSDENAAIFNVSDYGAVADMKDILSEALKILEGQ